MCSALNRCLGSGLVWHMELWKSRVVVTFDHDACVISSVYVSFLNNVMLDTKGFRMTIIHGVWNFVL
jgi:hypothetical protein